MKNLLLRILRTPYRHNALTQRGKRYLGTGDGQDPSGALNRIGTKVLHSTAPGDQDDPFHSQIVPDAVQAHRGQSPACRAHSPAVKH